MNSTRLVLALLLGALLFPGVGAAQATLTQTFELEPGWNAIFLEVQPTDNRIENLFAGLPVVSVWRFIPDEPGVDFIADPSEGLAQLDGWYGYFAESTGEGFLTNLFTLSANEAYLVRMGGTTTQTLAVTGTPVLERRRWSADRYTLTGFEVDEVAPPTFAEYFVGSVAHAGTDIYRLRPDGAWVPVGLAEPIAAGEAYWVWTEGPSTYQGPLELSLDRTGELEFGRSLAEEDLAITSALDVATDIEVRRAITGERLPLVFELEDPDTEEIAWPELPDRYVVPVAAGGDGIVSLGVRRADFTELEMAEIIEISNGFGVRKRVLVTGETVQAVIPPSAKASAGVGEKNARKSAVDPYAGLWIGSARVNRVSESQLAGTDPRPASGDFPLRVLIHVSATGQVRLLKEVTRMWEEGTVVPDPENPGFNVVESPGRYVLLTRDELLAAYEGSALRDGEIVGVRYSTVSFDFPGTEQEMQGIFGPNGLLSTTLSIPTDHPTNPFRHRYHPDHDNLDAQFLQTVVEAQPITREIAIELADRDDDPDPDFLSSTMTGTFSETIIGLHRNPIFVAGPINLRRISTVSALNE